MSAATASGIATHDTVAVLMQTAPKYGVRRMFVSVSQSSFWFTSNQLAYGLGILPLVSNSGVDIVVYVIGVTALLTGTVGHVPPHIFEMTFLSGVQRAY
jgi:hypothetical protein